MTKASPHLTGTGISQDVAQTVGLRLRAAREGLNKSLHDMAFKTKIREIFLMAIESGQWNAIPTGLSGRGLIRSYAKELGLKLPELDAASYEAIEESETGTSAFAERGPEVTVTQRQSASRSQNTMTSGFMGKIPTPHVEEILGLKTLSDDVPLSMPPAPTAVAPVPTLSAVQVDALELPQPVELPMPAAIVPPPAAIPVSPMVKPPVFSAASSEVQPQRYSRRHVIFSVAIVFFVIFFAAIFVSRSNSEPDPVHLQQQPAAELSPPAVQQNVEQGGIPPTTSNNTNSVSEIAPPSAPVSEKSVAAAQSPVAAVPNEAVPSSQPPPASVSVEPLPKQPQSEPAKSGVSQKSVAKLQILQPVTLTLKTDGKIIFSGKKEPGKLDVEFNNNAEILAEDGAKVLLSYGRWQDGLLAKQPGRQRRIVLKAAPLSKDSSVSQ